MISLNNVITALRQRVAYFDQRVAAAADISAVTDETFPVMPCCYVMAQPDQAEENNSGHEIRQKLTLGFSVVVIVANSPDGRGGQAYTEMEGVRQDLWQALLNWQADQGFDPLEYAGSQFIDLNPHRLIWQFTFKTKTEIGPADGYRPDYPTFDHVEVEVDLQPDAVIQPDPSYPTINVKIKPIDKET